MKNDLKKKFLDMLFEPEEPDEIEEAPIDDVRLSKPKEEKPVDNHEKVSQSLKAEDILYGTGEVKVNKSFIDYQEISQPSTNTYHEVREDALTDMSETYELKRHISPIFGETEPKKVKKEETVKKPTVSTPINTGKSDYTGVVLSPIFGYDNASADKARTDFVKNKKRDSSMLRQPTKLAAPKTLKVNELYEEPISLFEEPFESETKVETNDEPFTSEIKVIDIEGEPIEEVKEEYEQETVKPFEVNDLDDLDIYKTENEVEENVEEKAVDVSTGDNSGFIDDLLGDKD